MNKKIYTLFAVAVIIVVCGCGKTTIEQSGGTGQSSVTVEGNMDDDGMTGGVKIETPGASVDTSGGSVQIETPDASVDVNQ